MPCHAMLHGPQVKVETCNDASHASRAYMVRHVPCRHEFLMCLLEKTVLSSQGKFRERLQAMMRQCLEFQISPANRTTQCGDTVPTVAIPID